MNSEQASSAVARVPALDLLRLIAVLGVAFYHYGFRGPDIGGVTQIAAPQSAGFAMYGYLGVPVFFIISGFVIAYSAEGRTATGFAIARFSRIYPTFVVCMTFTCLTVLILGPPHFNVTFTQWAANLVIGAPAFRQHYMDTAYWSLVIEVTFYAWVTVLMAGGLFPRRIDAIVLTWLGLSLANELTIDAFAIKKVFLTHYSGFFATGLLIYEYHRGRRDAALYGLLVLASATAAFQAVHNLRWIQHHAGTAPDDRVVAAICVASIAAIIAATRIRRIGLSASTVLAIGGMTYPFYLLHQQLGYAILMGAAPASPALFAIIIVFGIAILSWVMWRYVDVPAHRWTRDILTAWSRQRGLAAKPPQPTAGSP